jgi:hypothetical protein
MLGHREKKVFGIFCYSAALSVLAPTANVFHYYDFFPDFFAFTSIAT